MTITQGEAIHRDILEILYTCTKDGVYIENVHYDVDFDRGALTATLHSDSGEQLARHAVIFMIVPISDESADAVPSQFPTSKTLLLEDLEQSIDRKAA